MKIPNVPFGVYGGLILAYIWRLILEAGSAGFESRTMNSDPWMPLRLAALPSLPGLAQHASQPLTASPGDARVANQSEWFLPQLNHWDGPAFAIYSTSAKLSIGKAQAPALRLPAVPFLFPGNVLKVTRRLLTNFENFLSCKEAV